jgi:D-glycero-D-manno-heptose 1,7-bisphosphate phosphatase
MTQCPAIFLDKDGTLLEDAPFNVDPALMRLAPQAAEGLRVLGKLNAPLIVISNQSGVALGKFEYGALAAVHAQLADLFLIHGARLAGFYACPHHPEGTVPAYALRCACRKPEPGLLYRAASTHGVDLSRSWFVGDILDDVEAGRRAGCRTILIDNGNETRWRRDPIRTPELIVGDLLKAAQEIAAAWPASTDSTSCATLSAAASTMAVRALHTVCPSPCNARRAP